MNVYDVHQSIPLRSAVDVLVAGGGIAGFSAAVAAVRAGARTLLVEPYGDLGGTATVCGIGAFCGETRGQGLVFDDVIAALERLEAIQPYAPYAERHFRKFHHELLKVVLPQIALDAGVRLLLHAPVVAAERVGNRLDAIILHTVAGLQAVRPTMVIDCTGDGAVAAAAGLPCMTGSPEDGRPLPMSMMVFMRQVGISPRMPLPDGCTRWESEADLPMLSVWNEVDGQRGIKIKVIGYDATDPADLTAAEVAGRRMALSAAEYLQRTELPGHALSFIATQIGVREGRRIVGEYVLTEADLRAGRRFDDGVALGVFYLDAHSPTARKNIYLTEDRDVPPYHVPLRSLRARGIDNLLMAGRCMSADQMALSSARVMTTVSMTGQAVGLAAARCAAEGLSTGQLDVAALQRELTALGAVL